ncbi:hypothetical protein JOC77_000976 [Peribacillus deserti]|uniref:Uncharacterized protein n=1 Tax=Peribacillus deserti TaxID=673318 RepID=A0ABS2QEK5_9BACI|nr:hypothetical protein [Peribacillus deserti]
MVSSIYSIKLYPYFKMKIFANPCGKNKNNLTDCKEICVFLPIFVYRIVFKFEHFINFTLTPIF